jgi:hypothetical protein
MCVLTIFTKVARWFSLCNIWKQPQSSGCLDSTGVLYVVELFSSLLLSSSRAWVAKSDKGWVLAVDKNVYVVNNAVATSWGFCWFICNCLSWNLSCRFQSVVITFQICNFIPNFIGLFSFHWLYYIYLSQSLNFWFKCVVIIVHVCNFITDFNLKNRPFMGKEW